MPQDADPSSLTGSESSSDDRGAENILLPGLAALWAETAGDPAICIAVLDGPVDTSHPCFQGAQLTAVETLVTGVADSGPATAHGTHVASVIFGQRDSSVQGIAPGCRGLIVPVFTSESCGGIAPCSQIDLARAITSAVGQGAHVINISGGELSASDEAHPLLENAVQHCADSGVLIVAAVGNDGCQCLHVPAAMSSVLAVGASDTQGVPLKVSNWGQAYKGILAPGKDIPGAVPSGGTAQRSGTSFATPIVSGAAALLLGLQVKQGRQPNPHAVREAILASAEPCDPKTYSDCPRFLVGRLNVEGARAIITNTTQNDQVEPAMDTQLDKQPKLNLKERTAEMSEFNELDAEQADVQKSSPPERPDTEPAVQHDAAQVSSHAASEPALPLSTAPPAVATSSNPFANPSRVAPSANGGAAALVYAIGSLDFDFGTEARRDAIQQAMGNEPFNKENILKHLDNKEYPWNAQSVTWTLEFDGTPVYAIQPQGPFASQTYAKLAEYENRFLTSGADRISVGGFIAGQTRLLNGQIVPVIVPEPRSLFDWNMAKLVTKVTEVEVARRIKAELEKKEEEKEVESKVEKKELEKEVEKKVEDKSKGFLDRIYYELRNLGVTPQERAINFATTKAYEIMDQVFVDTSKENLELDRIEVEQSPVCRPQSDCWDVKLTFFDPQNRFERAKKAYRITIDVSDVIPVYIGKLRSWSEYS